ncbi:hypothetical protein MLD38_023031 [Melastoma candidum]|uniref:Uncharacterized protein n=1 Tax=Melastoma candidum TaxID=119954 RepID=A0ACB9QL53_9MYRT|nr:hypothetical protein MLD38_023031 [Melastoma candidum]
MQLTSTNITNAVAKRLGTPQAKLAWIEILVVLSVLLNLLMVILGMLRPRRKSGFLKGASWLTFTLKPYLIAYTLGLMQDAPFRTEFFSFWGVFLVFALGSPDAFSAYSIEDHEQRKRYRFQVIVKIAVLMLLISMNIYQSKSFLAFSPILLWFATYLKLFARMATLGVGSRFAVERIYKISVEYLTSDSVMSTLQGANSLTMEGYNLPVSWRIFPFLRLLNTVKVVYPAYTRHFNSPRDRPLTLEDVWNCKEWPLISQQGRGDPDGRLKDMLLSRSLSQLLITMYAQYSVPSIVMDKTWDLIQNGVLRNHQRAFRVIEVELELVFNFFYADYASIGSLAGVFRFVGSGILSVVSIMLLVQLSQSIKPEETIRMPIILGHDVNVLVTFVIVAVFLVAELIQLTLLCFSQSFKVLLLLCYLFRETPWMRRLLGYVVQGICKMPQPKAWERKLHQYSILESHVFSPSPVSNFLRRMLMMDLVRPGEKEGRAIKLTGEIKEAVFNSLMRNRRDLRNGEDSLRTNGVSEKLAWACALKTQTHGIMVWHIATIFCEHHHKPPKDSVGDIQRDFHVATSLSKYLAYLVVYAPGLLPDHPFVTRHLFGHVVLEARKVFKGCRTNEQKMEKLNQIAGEPEEKIVNRGAKLGKTISDELRDSTRIWKLLAEFWSEMILYVAPSDNFTGHLEELANGGEFVTHLWALLRHAGVKRVEAAAGSPAPTNPGNQERMDTATAAETPENANIDTVMAPVVSPPREMVVEIDDQERGAAEPPARVWIETDK